MDVPLAHVPGGQPIGALERVSAKTMAFIRQKLRPRRPGQAIAA